MKRRLLSTLFIVVLVFGFTSFSHANFGAAQTSSVYGTLTSDTTWTKADSPYVFTGDFRIAAGVTLTVEPGVTVDLADYYFQVDGTLYARGTDSDNIIFGGDVVLYDNERIKFTDTSESWDDQTGTGCIIDNAVINSLSMVIDRASPQISNNFFNDTSWSYMITVEGGSPLIVNNTMRFDGIGIRVNGGSPVITNNIIEGNSLHSDGIHSTGSLGGEVMITGNIIINNENGIISYAGNQIIERNQIHNNEIGIDGCGTIQNNTIADCSTAIKNPFYPSTINYNNIVNYSQNSIYIEQSSDVNATYNWWGTTDTQAIEQSIYDFEDNHNLGKVTFEPFLTELNPHVTPPIDGTIPDVTPTPTPTATPPPVQPKETKLTLSCSSSTSHENFRLDITGSLTAGWVGVANVPVLLWYSGDSGESWNILTTSNTDNQGYFSFFWMPSIRDNYRFKAVWEGDSTYLAVNTTINFAATSFEQNVFSVATDSTLTNLVFDSEKRELRFRVEGPDATTGYANIYVSQAFLGDTSDLKVYLDDTEISYANETQRDSQRLTITYTHSAHQVTMKFGSVGFDVNQIGQALVIGLPLSVLVTYFVVKKLRNRKPQNNSD